MSRRIPLAWANRPGLRLRLTGGRLLGLRDDAGPIPPERYAVLEQLGEIALTAEPQGEVVAEVEDDAPPQPWQGADE